MKKIIFILAFLAIGLHAEEIYATFNVEAEKSANLAFSSSGIVNSVMANIGTEVKKGDTLATLQNDDLKAMLHVAQTALKYAKKEYERQVKVKNIIDQSKFDQYAFKYENAKAQLQYQQALLDKTILKAPFDGVIFAKSVEKGDVVSGAMIRTIFKIQSLHKRKLVLEFDQKYWNVIRTGDRFSYKIDGGSKVHQGSISKIYPSVDSNKRKMKAEVLTEDVIVGLFGDGTVTSSGKKQD
ncbi:MAG: transporter [Epsilonproteobacteria bacterium (ex Lamellibrachia satsuma)]|nr:MAG: transporter [Epsilonproteobacteria bacterium (ex Lamellibrachia satsuma)]